MPIDEEFEVLRDVYRVIERRDGAVYRTEFVEKRWVPMGTPRQIGDEIYATLSTTDPDFPTLPRRRQ